MGTMYSRSELINTLAGRKAWYERAVAILEGREEWGNHFNWPPVGAFEMPPNRDNLSSCVACACAWLAAAKEIGNTITMLEHGGGEGFADNSPAAPASVTDTVAEGAV